MTTSTNPTTEDPLDGLADVLGLNAMRVTPTALEAATVHFSRDDKHIELVGVMHFAAPSFWDDIHTVINRRLAAGGEVQSEMITGAPKRPIRSLLVKHLNKRLQSRGLVSQMTALDYSPASVIRIHDITYQQMVTSLGRPAAAVLSVMVVGVMGVMSALTPAQRDAVFGENFVSSPGRLHNQGAFKTMHTERERIALDAVEAAPGDVTTLWGAGHLVSMSRTLVERGWTVESVEWRKVMDRVTPPTEPQGG